MAAVDLCSFNHGLGIYIRYILLNTNINAQPMVECTQSTAAMNYFFSNMTNTVIFMTLGYLKIRHTTADPFSPLHIWIRILVVYVVKISRDIVTRFTSRYHYQEIEDVQYSICLYREMWSFKCHCNWRLVTRCTFNDCSF